jgi:transketolase
MYLGKKRKDAAYTEGLRKLLEVKDSDIRMVTFRQGASAIEKGIHMGGASSATIPLVALFYGGYMNYDVQDPTKEGQDYFVLSKGHAVAPMASVYADVGYFPAAVLENSRSHDSILNGHPGPILPGVAIATGPLGQGVAVAQGLAMAGKQGKEFDVFSITGDGELQEGVVWEAFMLAPQKRLDNLCVLIDKNEGQLDVYTKLHFSMDKLGDQLAAFGWKVVEVDATSYHGIMDALESFSHDSRDGRPTVIICNSYKGYGSFSEGMDKHKITLTVDACEQEIALQKVRRAQRYAAYVAYLEKLKAEGDLESVKELEAKQKEMNIKEKCSDVLEQAFLRKGKVPARDKAIKYDASKLPSYAMDAKVMGCDVITAAMKQFAKDQRVMSVDSDLASTSGLQGGVGSVDQSRAINAGIAEANMMCIGESFAALGSNAWVSTFCPFFDWKVLRRIAVSHQERIEAIEDSANWLNEGHGLDLTFLATAANLDTQVNGATHMGNDDNLFFSNIAGLKIIDVSCPNQLVEIMKWIMDGNKGLVYLRLMRAASGVLYESGQPFTYGKAWKLHGSDKAKVAIVSSGRGSHEALAAAKKLADKNIDVAVYDMPSFDAETMETLIKGDIPVVVAEQNNGYLWMETGKMVLNRALEVPKGRLVAVNTADKDGSYRFIHSATYEELTKHNALDADSLATLLEKLA